MKKKQARSYSTEFPEFRGQTGRVSEIDVRIAPKSGRHWRGNLLG
jgi:hypothetical protein